MVGGSGRHTAPAVKRQIPPTRPKIRSAVPVGAVLALSACVYFNAIYNADRLFDQGRQDIESGRVATGEASLATSIEKAERVLANSPDSRWADDALRLIVRARVLRSEWPKALDAAERLMSYAASRSDSAEAAGYMGLAEAHLEHPARADSLLTFALQEVRETGIRAWFLYGRGLANRSAGRIDAADADLRAAAAARTNWLDPRLERIRMLSEADRPVEAAEALRALVQREFQEFEEREVIDVVRLLAARHPDAARTALATAEEAGLSRAGRARLLKIRGDLRVAAGELDDAVNDYRTGAAIDPASPAAAEAKLALTLLDMPGLRSVADLYRKKERIEEIQQTTAGRSNWDVTRLGNLLDRMIFWIENGELGYILAAEAARDELGAIALARTLFIRYADELPNAPWAPKALLAAIALGTPESTGSDGDGWSGPDTEELRDRLLQRYPDSPYLGTVTGDSSDGRFTYERLEEGLQRQLERLRELTENELRERRMGRSRDDRRG